MQNNINKIFGIGLSRTGTTSLTKALEILGYKSKHFPKVYLDKKKEIKIKAEYLKNYDALTDTPIALLYEKLDILYPKSKFILTIRDKKQWLKSCKYMFKNMPKDKAKAIDVLHEKLYNDKNVNKKNLSKSYDKHTNEVLSYFENRNSDLLIIDITKREGWEKLCPFLKKPIPNVPFPNLNTSPKLINKIKGSIGIFLKRNAPILYTKLKNIKKTENV